MIFDYKPTKDAKTLEGKKASDFLQTTGGTVNGSLIVKSDGEDERALSVRNSARKINFEVKPNGEFHLWDGTNVKSLMILSADGNTNTFDGTASGNLPLTGGTVNGSIKANGIESADGFTHSTRSGKLHLFKFTDSAGEWGSQIRDYKADGSYNALIFQNTNKISWGTFDANNTKTGGGEILHTGNMASHVLPLTNTSAKTLEVQADTVLKLKNTGSGDFTWLQFLNSVGTLGYYGFQKDKTPVVSIDGTARDILHTGNSSKVVISSTAPSDTSALWIDTSA